MPDFSDKYKKALEYQEISPDFKERTARLMAELRDSEEPVLKTAEDERAAASVALSDNEEKFPRRINYIKVISAIAAAAACLTVGVALNRAGIFDRASDLAAVNSDGAVTEATDIMETFEDKTDATAAMGAENISGEFTPSDNGDILIHGSEQAENEPSEDSGEADEMPAPAVGAAAFAVEETAPLTREAIPEENASPDSIAGVQGYEDIAEELPDYEGAAPDEAVPTTEEPVEAAASQNDTNDPAETGLILEPFSDEADAVPDGEVFEEENEEAAEDDLPVEEIATSDMSRSADFSPRRAVAGFPAQTSSALITPSFEDTISEDGTVVKYQAKRIRSVTKLLELNKELYAYTEEDSAAVGDAAPSDSRYIIDYTGDQGNAMRIYIGSRYICFAYEGGFYTYELTEEEYKALDSSLFGLIS
ncbi:MAG: hypothetical protein MSJ26_07255 [Oscillospiraceae bacterium]|nr:hypothetical protein [Oscillospiraceae bacterium]